MKSKMQRFLRRVVLFPFMVLMGGVPEGDGLGGDDGGSPPPAPAAPAAPATPEGITLSREEYGQLMGTIAALQQRLEEREDTGKPGQPSEPAASVDLDQMTNTQLANYLLNAVQTQVGQPLLNSLMTLSVKEELREVKAAHPDFDTYRDEVYKEAQANTHLSLDQAYLIVKAKKTGTTPPPTPKTPADTPKPPVGEKPGVTPTATTPSTNLSIKEAAQAAFKALQME